MVTLTSKPITESLTEDDLPCDDDQVMETQRHKYQMDLLQETLLPWLEKRQDGYAGANMFVYYSLEQVKNRDFSGPDFFAVLNVSNRERKSWVSWQEGKVPDVIIELLSETTANFDKTEKKKIYQDKMKAPEYFWYDPFDTNDFKGFRLENGVYQPLQFDSQNRYISQQLQLALVLWYGVYRGVETFWLRWETLVGELLLTEREFRDKAQAKADEAQAKAHKAQKLAEKLREMGINPDEI